MAAKSVTNKLKHPLYRRAMIKEARALRKYSPGLGNKDSRKLATMQDWGNRVDALDTNPIGVGINLAGVLGGAGAGYGGYKLNQKRKTRSDKGKKRGKYT